MEVENPANPLAKEAPMPRKKNLLDPASAVREGELPDADGYVMTNDQKAELERRMALRSRTDMGMKAVNEYDSAMDKTRRRIGFGTGVQVDEKKAKELDAKSNFEGEMRRRQKAHYKRLLGR